MTYGNYIFELLRNEAPGAPIHISRIAEQLAAEYHMELSAATAATSVAVKRIMDGKLIPELRRYQKGIYYRTVLTPFGELGIDKERLIAEKYLMPDIGYETGPGLLYRLGLATQIPRERILATNMATNGIFSKAPVDVEKPYVILARHIRRKGLEYETLLYYADRYYNKNTVLQIAHTAGEGRDFA